jgi:hypothetical protein
MVTAIAEQKTIDKSATPALRPISGEVTFASRF